MNKGKFASLLSVPIAVLFILASCATNIQPTEHTVNSQPSGGTLPNENYSIITTPKNDATTITHGDAAALIYSTAKRYNPSITLNELFPGDSERKTENITNAEVFALLVRAFGPIPEADGNNKRLANLDASYTNVPEWASDDFEALRLAGVLYGDGRDANAFADKNELELITGRLIRLYGNNPKDEFYEYVNKQWLDTATLPAGSSTHGTLVQINRDTVKQIENILDELAAGTYEKDTPEYIVSVFYKNALARETRNMQGIDPIKKYLEMIDSVKTVDDLVDIHGEIAKETGWQPLYKFRLDADIHDSNKKAIYFECMDICLAKDEYVSKNEKQIKALEDWITQLFVITGESETTAKQNAGKITAFEAQIAEVMLSPQETYDPDLAYETSDLSKVDALFRTVPMPDAARKLGLAVSDGSKVFVCDMKVVEKYAEALTNDNIELFKAYLKFGLLKQFGAVLSEDIIDAMNEYKKASRGVDTPVSYKRRAVNLTLATLGDYLGQIYIKRCFSQEAKADVERMAEECFNAYKEELAANAWLGPETKVKALKKLDSLTYKIGYPDKWSDFLNGYEITSVSDGGSLFDNICAVNTAAHAKMAIEQYVPPDRSDWELSVYDVNAYYNPQYNEIVFPAGILQAPIYDVNARREENLGGIGAAIAHEMSHAFDNDGAKYDENGNAANWWTEKDYKEFEKRTQAVAEFYDGIELAPGIFSNGELTLSENIADLEGVLCALSVAKKDPNADLKAFFESYAVLWRGIYTREAAEYYNVADIHANKRVRVNRTLQNVEEFYESYDIKEGDNMFVPESERVKIW